MHQSRLDLSSPVFRRATRGFDPEEVRAFLDVFAPDYEEAYAELERLRASVASVSREVEELRDSHRSLVRVLAAAEEGAQVHAAGARREAERIMESAEAEATALVGGHEHLRREIEAEIDDIERRRRHAEESLEGLIEHLKTGSPPQLLQEPSGSARIEPPEPRALAPVLPHESAELPVEDVVPAVEADAEPARKTEAETPASEPSWTETWVLPGTDETVQFAPAFSVKNYGEPPEEPEFSEEPDLAIDVRAEWRERSRRFVRRGAAAGAALLARADRLMPRCRRDVRWVAAAGAVASVACIAVLAWPRVGVVGSSASPRSAREEAQPVAAATVAAAQQSEAVDPLTVKLWAARPCWIRLVVDDKAETRVLAQGEELVRGAARYVELRVGDAGALTVEVNGSRLPPLGRAGHVVDHRFEVGAVIE
jgi:cell division initiation protein